MLMYLVCKIFIVIKITEITTKLTKKLLTML